MTVTIELSSPQRWQADVLVISGIDVNPVSDQKVDLTPQPLKKKNAIQKVLREHEALWEKLAQL